MKSTFEPEKFEIKCNLCNNKITANSNINLNIMLNNRKWLTVIKERKTFYVCEHCCRIKSFGELK